MNRDIEVLARLRKIRHVAEESESYAAESATYTDVAALALIRSLVIEAAAILSGSEGAAPAVAMTSPASQSSVQIEGRAKGPPAITVKVYDADPAQAMLRAAELYDATVAKYAEEAKTP